MCITTFEYTVCISTHSVVSRICVFAFESMANIYISLVNRWEKKRLLIELEIDFALSTKRVICDFRVVIFMTVASFEFFSTLNAHGYAQIRCSSHHLVSMGAVLSNWIHSSLGIYWFYGSWTKNVRSISAKYPVNMHETSNLIDYWI